MPIDRRITNGLAWAGALAVVAIPAADVALRQFEPQAAPQVAVIEEQAETPSLPTPASLRPAPVVAAVEKPVVSQPPATTAEPDEAPETAPDPVTTASASAASDDAVDDFLKSGRPLPSYISGGGATTPTQTAAITPVTTARPVATTPAPAPEQVASAPRTRIVTFPTPVSERPASLPRTQVAAQPPLVIDTEAPVPVDTGTPVITASDLEDWESGPLSEFLARRQGSSGEAPADYDADGFFLDEGPNSRARVWRFPRAYGNDYYPFE